jgi:hypothetical protein
MENKTYNVKSNFVKGLGKELIGHKVKCEEIDCGKIIEYDPITGDATFEVDKKTYEKIQSSKRIGISSREIQPTLNIQQLKEQIENLNPTQKKELLSYFHSCKCSSCGCKNN